MDMKRKIKIILTLLLVACVAFTVVGCNTEKGKGSLNCELNATQCTIKCFEEFQLEISADGEPVEAEWVSLNNSVVSVENGLVIAKKTGSGVIKAVVRGKSYSCLVNVVSNDKVPAIFTDDDSFSLVKDGSLKISPKIMFDGELYDDGKFTLEIDDQNVCEIQDQTLVGKAYGQTVLRIIGEWRGADEILLVKEVPLYVKRDANILTNQSEVTLYTENKISGTENCAVQQQLGATLYVDNVVDDTKTVVWETSDDNLINITEDGLVSANTNGETGEVLVWAKVQTNEIDVVSDAIKITIAKPVIDKTEEISLVHDMALKTQAIDAEKVFGNDSTEVVSVVDVVNATEMFKDGKVEYSSNAAMEREWIVSSKTYSVKVTAQCVTKVFYTADDLKQLDEYGKPKSYNQAAQNYFSGWFLLGADIDYGGKSFESGVRTAAGWGGLWDSMVFDGQGYSINNITFPSDGLFGMWLDNCTIKNLIFTEVTLPGAKSTVLCNTIRRNSVLENVFVSVKSTVASGTLSKGLVLGVDETVTIKNLVVDVLSATNVDDFSGVTNTTLINPRLNVFDAVYTIGAKVCIGSPANENGVYDEVDTKNNTELVPVAANHTGYVGGGYETDAEFVADKEVIFTGDFAKVFTLATEGGQTVLKFMSKTVKTFETQAN